MIEGSRVVNIIGIPTFFKNRARFMPDVYLFLKYLENVSQHAKIVPESLQD